MNLIILILFLIFGRSSASEDKEIICQSQNGKTGYEIARDFVYESWMSARAELNMDNSIDAILAMNKKYFAHLSSLFNYHTGVILWSINGTSINYVRMYKCNWFT